MANKNIDLEIVVKDLIDKSKLICKNFLLFIKEDFLIKNKNKAHNLENHIENFKEKIKLNQQKENTYRYQKYDIYYVNYWINIWNEINGVRPSLIIKSNRYNWWYDIIVIPMTWLYDDEWNQKQLDTFDVIIMPDKTNKLKKESLLKMRHIKSISKKRILWKIWELENIENNWEKLYDVIDINVKRLIWIK